MASDKQIHANQRNAAKSTGPKFSAGKAASSRNAVKHGFRSEVALHLEPKDDYNDYLASYVRRFQPIDQVEYDCVEQLAESRWRRKRMVSVEACLLDLEMGRKLKDVQTGDKSGVLHVARCFEDRHGRRSQEILQRYIVAAERSYTRALNELRMLQASRFNQPEPECEAEESASEFPEPTQSLFLAGEIVPEPPSQMPKAA